MKFVDGSDSYMGKCIYTISTSEDGATWKVGSVDTPRGLVSIDYAEYPERSHIKYSLALGIIINRRRYYRVIQGKRFTEIGIVRSARKWAVELALQVQS